MYPTLYHFFYDMFGLDGPAVQWMKIINSFGFFVALAFISAHYLLSSELKRREGIGQFKPGIKEVEVGHPPKWTDVSISTLIGFILGYKFVYIISHASEAFGGGARPQDFLLSAEGSWIGGIIGAGFFGWSRWREAKKQELPNPEKRRVTVHPYEHTGNITMVAAISGILGAKLFHLFENPKQFVEFFTDPSVDNFLSGLTIYGGLIVGGTITYLYIRRLGFPMLHLLDAAAPGLILAYGVGRIGCQVSGDGDWGIVNTDPVPGWLSWLPDWAWSYNYPNNVNGVGVPILDGTCFEGYCTQLPLPVFPTPLYETTMAILIFALLWFLRKRLSIPGGIFALYLVFNGIERFLIEQIRVNNKMDLLGMEVTQAQVISTLFFLSGIALFIILRIRHLASKTASS